MEKLKDGRVDFLDFMRVFAFSSVLIAHIFHQGLYNASVNTSLHLTVRTLAGLIYDTCFAGAAGVVVFFITSGYIITHVLQKENFLEFGIKRVFRIYPLYILAVILELAINSYNGVELPPMSVIVPRLLLLGDVFHTPYALGGVEWTLRVEVMFYVFMGLLRFTGALNFTRVIPLLYLGIAFFLYSVHPFPRFAGWTDGYLGIYGPYLFMGSIIYLYEKKLSSFYVSAISIVCMMAIFLVYTAEIKAVLKETNHGVVALFIFLGAWFYRGRFVSGALVRTLSEMTYAIYLLHLILWKHLAGIGAAYGPSFINADLQALVMLLAICFVLCKTVEKQGVAIGRSVVDMVYRRGSSREAVTA
nr:acyltransferase [uncultured Pseudomonas sp.]